MTSALQQQSTIFNFFSKTFQEPLFPTSFSEIKRNCFWVKWSDRINEREKHDLQIWSQFHQHFTRGFFVQKFCAKLFCT